MGCGLKTTKSDNATINALNKSNVARYIQLASLFRQRIDSGEWGVGDKIPTVAELSKQCGVATMTIRQALDIVDQEGLIERFRAKGTFVKDRPSRDFWCEIKTDWSGMLIARQDAIIEVVSDTRNVELPADSSRGSGNPSPGYRHLQRKHSRNGMAFLMANVYVDEKICPQIPEESYSKLTALRLVADIPGQEIVDATQVVTVAAADLEIATQLNISIGDPVAKVRRIAVNQHGDIILLAIGIYRGDVMEIKVRLC